MTKEQPMGQALAASSRKPALIHQLQDRRSWMLLGASLAGVGLVLKWDWLTAVGAAPILLAVLPCVAMCALGLCMRGSASSSCSSPTTKDTEK